MCFQQAGGTQDPLIALGLSTVDYGQLYRLAATAKVIRRLIQKLELDKEILPDAEIDISKEPNQ